MKQSNFRANLTSALVLWNERRTSYGATGLLFGDCSELKKTNSYLVILPEAGSFKYQKNLKDFDQPGKTSFNNNSLLVNVFCDCTTVAFIFDPG